MGARAASPTPEREAGADFASAAMCRVLVQGMRDLGLRPPVEEGAPARGRIALESKRAIVAAALAQGGWACLPALGQGLSRFRSEPTHRALCSARDAADLLGRWLRLERYVHSRHRTRVLGTSSHGVRLEHVALAGCPPPLPAEDLVVAGVLAALLEAAGARTVELGVGRVRAFPDPDVVGLTRAAQAGRTGEWTLRWRGFDARLGPTSADPGADPPEVEPPHDWSAAARRVYARLLAALVGPPSVAVLAAELGTRPRTLQRLLAAEGLAVSTILLEARVRVAAWHLIHGRAGLAEIGFLAGYADQAHFTRGFADRVGMTPGRYRQAFAHDGDPGRGPRLPAVG